MSGSSLESTIPIPDIITWFSYLDQCEQHGLDDVIFAPFGPTLSAKGFRRISQLSHEYVSLSDLQGWLGIEIGTAILIFQHVEAELWAVNS
ncbi:hypothetical protein PAXRUDRAFT_148728 [Paxillus rubicundulus Ve08.2h10]|uniref:SAM domain-containing protein n=1 Tax=Paxillus rubicundulus Ve08.2h10 TaxID=930991 RepID=A0A0D0D579_9AGAM|nr:hypothetical protein PAXRUDRAFT_148728 [Paxillus rubicundulus Ve08.2h10]